MSTLWSNNGWWILLLGSFAMVAGGSASLLVESATPLLLLLGLTAGLVVFFGLLGWLRNRLDSYEDRVVLRDDRVRLPEDGRVEDGCVGEQSTAAAIVLRLQFLCWGGVLIEESGATTPTLAEEMAGSDESPRYLLAVFPVAVADPSGDPLDGCGVAAPEISNIVVFNDTHGGYLYGERFRRYFDLDRDHVHALQHEHAVEWKPGGDPRKGTRVRKLKTLERPNLSIVSDGARRAAVWLKGLEELGPLGPRPTYVLGTRLALDGFRRLEPLVAVGAIVEPSQSEMDWLATMSGRNLSRGEPTLTYFHLDYLPGARLSRQLAMASQLSGLRLTVVAQSPRSDAR